jgi:hypothetical protein
VIVLQPSVSVSPVSFFRSFHGGGFSDFHMVSLQIVCPAFTKAAAFGSNGAGCRGKRGTVSIPSPLIVSFCKLANPVPEQQNIYMILFILFFYCIVDNHERSRYKGSKAVVTLP